MREFATPAAFRAAVEARLRERARLLGIPTYILRRQAALERLIVRLTKVAPDCWALKGGLALETRLGERARVSLDLDADHARGAKAARADLQRASAEEVGDHFGYAIVGSEELRDAGISLAVRYKLDSTIAERPFEPLQVDVTVAAPDSWEVQPARRPGLLADLGLGPIDVLLVPLERHVAEKLHAYSRTYRGGRTTRARDLADLLLIRQYGRVDTTLLQEAVERVFDRRTTHPVPLRLPAPPRALAVAYRSEAERVDLTRSLAEAHETLAAWLDPVLAAIAHSRETVPSSGPTSNGEAT